MVSAIILPGNIGRPDESLLQLYIRHEEPTSLWRASQKPLRRQARREKVVGVTTIQIEVTSGTEAHSDLTVRVISRGSQGGHEKGSARLSKVRTL